MRGGDPGTVALICSYLLLEPTQLNTMLARDEQKTTQSWTLPYVPGPRFDPRTPVWVLTSSTTFSGGEELTYDLQQLGRATVVGETTGGGAHAREGFPVHPHLELTVPVVRAVNPVSGTNWEGVGVRPDVAVPAALALETAHGLALDHLAGRADLSAALRREVGTLRGRAD
jgi:C-terminal processing protease CtpA/Prc